MMIPKNVRNRRKELAPRDTVESSKMLDESKNSTELKTITRSSNHSCSGSNNYVSSDVDSQCSWVELDFDRDGGGKGKGKGKGGKERPVSHVEIAQYLIDDQESNCESNRDRTDDNSSTTSVLSEDFSVENGKHNSSRNNINNNNISKSSNVGKTETKLETTESHDADSATCSYGSASFADEIAFDDLLNESLIPSNSNLAASITTDDLFPADAIIDINASDRPSSYGSRSQNSMKPSSARSKGKKQPKNKISPRPKQSKKKNSSSKSKAAALALRKKVAAFEKEGNGVEGATADETKDQYKKKISSKPKHFDAAMYARRRHLHLQPANAEKDETSNNGAADGDKESKKKPSPKSTKTSSSSVPSRRRRLRTNDKVDELLEDETNREEDETIREESQRSMNAVEDKGTGEKATGDVKKRTERPRKSKSLPHKHRKAPGRSASGRNEGIARNNIGTGGGDRHDADRKREVRKRYKKKHSSSVENESDEEKSKGVKPRSGHREGKKKARSKSNESEANSETKPTTKIDRHSDGKRRKKKKHAEAAEATATATATALAPGSTPIALQTPTMVPLKSDHNEQIIFPLQSVDSEQCDEETMEKMTYSFQFDSDEDPQNNWLNSNASTSSSLSYNSFAQFSLDVTEVSGHFVSGEITGHTRSTYGGCEVSGHAHSTCSFLGSEFTGHTRGELTAHTHSTAGAGAGYFPETDASVGSFTSNHGDASVVFMAGKSSGSGKNSVLAAHSFDNDHEDNDENDGTRSIRSMPEHTESMAVKPEKRLRRRLKKKETPAPNEDGSSRNKHSSEMKKKVRRTRSGGVERTKSISSSGKRAVERTRSHNEAMLPGGTKVLVPSSAKRQEIQEKSNRRNKVKNSVLASITPKHGAKSKLSHLRVLSISPKNKMKGKVLLDSDEDSDLEEEEDKLGEIIPVNDNMVPLYDADDVDPDKLISASWRSPIRSPRTRQIRRSFSGPSPSLHPESIPSTPLVRREGRHSTEVESPLSFVSAPSYLDSKKPKRNSSPDKKALLGADAEDDDYDSCEDCYSPHSVNSPHDKFPRRGLQRTPSSLLSAVRSHVKNKKDSKLNNSRSNMLSMVKKTFSVSGRGSSTFANIADEMESRYVGRKERQRKLNESENRKGQIKNSLYACMSDSDDSVEISAEFTELTGENSMNFSALEHHSTSSFAPKRHQSLDKSKMSLDKSKMMNSQNSEGSSERPSRPRRVHSLPIGIRRFPPA